MLELEQTLCAVLIADCVLCCESKANWTLMETLSAKMKKTSLMPRWWKKRFTAVITESDPSFKVVYLGNVLTGWAKGIGFVYYIFAVALFWGFSYP